MRAYQAIIGARFRALLQYRAAALGGLFTQIAFGLTRLMILEAFYRSSTAAQPMSLAEVVGYVWLGQATLLLVPWRADADVAQQIRTGTIAYELARPLDLYAVWFARAVAGRTAPVLLRMLPMFVVAMLLVPSGWRLAPPPSLAAAALWLATFGGAVLLSSAITALMSVSMLWTVSAQGVPLLLANLATFGSGLVIPLPLFPGWARTVLTALPFAGMLDLPARVYTGNIAAADAGWVLAHQLAWVVALAALGRWLLGRGLRRVVVQGG
jgi:ABC-2 type transport system permease protein